MVSNPQLYKSGVNNQYFSSKVFFQWAFMRLIQSVIILVVALIALQFASDIWHGQSIDIWTIGMIVYGAVVFNVNNKLLQDSNSLNYIMLTMTILSQCAFFLMLFIVS